MLLTAIGLFGLAIYQLSTKDYVTAVQSVLAALAAMGVCNSHKTLLNHMRDKA